MNGDEEKETIMKRFLATFEEGEDLRAEVSRTDDLTLIALTEKRTTPNTTPKVRLRFLHTEFIVDG